MSKGKDLIFKTLALAGLTIGAVTIGMSTVTRIKRKNDEKEAKDVIEETEVIAENFSGATGKMLKRKFTKHDFWKNGLYSNNLGQTYRNTHTPCTTTDGKDGEIHMNGWGGKMCLVSRNAKS